MIRAVVFDFDGVIANSEPLHYRAFREVLAETGLALSERDYYDKYLGFDDVGAFRAVADDAARPVTDARISELVARKAIVLEQLEHDGSVLFAGARDAIHRMAGLGLIAIASGARRPEILRVLEHERLTPLFRVVVAAEDTPRSKPAPDPYLLAVARLMQTSGQSLTADECVAVEDSHWGLDSARTAGLHTIAVSHTYPAADLTGADVVIDHLDQLTGPLLERLRPRS